MCHPRAVFVILGLDPRISVLKNSKISYYVILGLDPRISVLRNSGIPYRDCPVKPDNDTRFVILGLFFVILGLDPRISIKIVQLDHFVSSPDLIRGSQKKARKPDNDARLKKHKIKGRH